MNIGFVLFEDYHGRKNVGSSRIRGQWLINHWKDVYPDDNAERFVLGKNYDVIVFQKAYWLKMAEAFDGIKIFDLCDADWLHWKYETKEMIELCDAVTTSSLEIAKFLLKMTDKPVAFIPDRIDFDTIKNIKEHEGPIQKVVWFGGSENFEVLDDVVHALMKRKMELVVISNKPYSNIQASKKLEMSNYLWSEETVNDDILRGDVVVNPKITTGRYKYKSDNKTIHSYALGMPVAETDFDLDNWMKPEKRQEIADKNLKIVREERDVKTSVKELKEFIDEISKEKNRES